MKKSIRHRFGPSLLVAAAGALLAACADETPVGPGHQSGLEGFAALTAASAGLSRSPDLGTCGNLQVEAGNKLAFHVYAEGVQIYSWNGTSWSFVGPWAELSADPAGKGTVGIHYAGPTWESNSGSKVVGAVVERCTPDPTAVAWLLLEATSTEGPGIFEQVTFIQRLNTVGGLAPSTPGSSIGQEARVPYTTEYLFYRAK